MNTQDLRLSKADELGLSAAFEQAKKSFEEGGMPIGAALVYDDGGHPQLLGVGHNARVQKSSPILHGETATLDNAGRQRADVYRKSTMYTTLSPCSMCSGAILLYKIPRVVIGENSTFRGEEELLQSRGVEVVVLDNAQCKELMSRFIKEHPEIWFEDIGEMHGSEHPDQRV